MMCYCTYEGCPVKECKRHPKNNPFKAEAKDLRGNCGSLWAWRKQREGMRVGEAYSICHNIDDPNITDEEKGLAIWKVASMETHNSVTKAAMVKVIRYLLGLCFEPPEG